MDLDVLFLGTAGSSPSPRRGLPATLVRRGGDRLLFDCGEGTQRQLMQSVGLMELEELFITHFHADHVLGLPGMLKTFGLRQRERDLVVYGPRGLRRVFDMLSPVIGRLTFRVVLNELEPNDELERDGYRIAAFDVDHGGPGLGWAIVRIRARGVRPGAGARAGRHPGPRLRPAPAGRGGERGQAGAGDGRDPARRKIVLTGDTAPCDMTRLVAWEADLLVHEATFMDDDAERAAETRHSTAAQAAGLAAAANVRMLALTHISPRYSGAEVRDEARAVFENVIVPRDFDRVEIPFPERGEPVHVRASDRPPEREPVA